MTEVKVPTFIAQIYMAGDIAHARQILQRYVMVGACVTIEPVDYIFTGGAESGFRVRLINYPRFPRCADALRIEARVIADLLLKELSQHSFSIVMPDETIWFSKRAS